MAIRQKVAFVHYQKAMGVFVNVYLIQNVFNSLSDSVAEQGWKTWNSWRNPFRLGRDWTQQELLELAAEKSPHQQFSEQDEKVHRSHWQHGFLDRQYVHNHHSNWNLKTVQAFKDNDWFVFTFLRDPADLLCSTYFWAREKVANGVPAENVFRPETLLNLELDAFLRSIFDGTHSRQKYRISLPDYFHLLDFKAEFTDQNFSHFLKRYFNHDLIPSDRKLNSSSNRGYRYYRENGLVSDFTHELIESDPHVRETRAMLGPI